MACCAVAAFIVMKMISVHGTIQGHTDKIAAQFGIEKTATCRLKVTGITCAACVESIESKLIAMPGVINVTISQFLSQALIEYLPQDVIVEELIATVEEVGFGAERILDDQDWAAEIKNADDARLQQIQEWRMSLYGASAAALVVVLIGLLPANVDLYLSHSTRLLVQASLCGAVIAVFGRQIHYESLLALRRRSPDMSLLTTLGTTFAFLGSLYDVWGLKDLRSTSGLGSGSFDTTAILLCVVLGGRLLKSIIVRQSVSSLSSLASLVAETAELVTGDIQDPRTVTVAVGQLQVGDRVAVSTGDIVPVDGSILHGSGYVTETHITGEIVPAHRFTGKIYAGSVIQDGHFVIQASQKRQLTWLQHTLQLMSEGDAKKGSVQSLAEYLSTRFSWFIMTVAIFTFVETSWLEWGNWSKAFYRVTAIFLCACPCALGLASPTAIMVGLDVASKGGILIKGGSHSIEAAAHVNTIFLDKTGTLTTGELSVVKTEPSSHWDSSKRQRMRWWLAILAVEQGCRHPLSHAITVEARKNLVDMCGASGYAEGMNLVNILGQGVKGDIRLPTNLNQSQDTIHVMVGNRAFLKSNSVQDIPETEPPCDRTAQEAMQDSNRIDSYIAIDGIFAGRISCADKVRGEAAEMVRTLKRRGYNVGMITGGDTSVAHSVAQTVGIHSDWVYSNLLPQEKLRIITKTRNLHGPVAMIGDNLNDVQCMTAADFSVAAFVDINSLTAVTADVLLLANSSDIESSNHIPTGLEKVTYLFELSGKIYAKIWQNLIWAIIYNSVAVVVATGIFEEFGLTLSPFYASLGMSLSSVFVITNSMKL